MLFHPFFPTLPSPKPSPPLLLTLLVSPPKGGGTRTCALPWHGRRGCSQREWLGAQVRSPVLLMTTPTQAPVSIFLGLSLPSTPSLGPAQAQESPETLPLPSCVALGISLKLSGPLFLVLQNGYKGAISQRYGRRSSGGRGFVSPPMYEGLSVIIA